MPQVRDQNPHGPTHAIAVASERTAVNTTIATPDVRLSHVQRCHSSFNSRTCPSQSAWPSVQPSPISSAFKHVLHAIARRCSHPCQHKKHQPATGVTTGTLPTETAGPVCSQVPPSTLCRLLVRTIPASKTSHQAAICVNTNTTPTKLAELAQQHGAPKLN